MEHRWVGGWDSITFVVVAKPEIGDILVPVGGIRVKGGGGFERRA